MKKYFRFIFLTLISILVLTACGNASPSTTINVTLTDFEFTPNTFTVPAGAQISFIAVNNGAVEHSFVIMKLGHEIKAKFTDADMPNIYWGELSVMPGQTATDTFTAPSEPGTYQVLCHMSGHFEAGMVAKLIVVASK